MTSLNQDFTLYQGETKTLRVPVVDADGAPQTLTGAEVVWEAWRTPGSPVISKGATITLYSAEGTNDGVQIPLLPADSEAVQPAVYTHECRVTLAGAEGVIFTGKMTVLYSETKE